MIRLLPKFVKTLTAARVVEKNSTASFSTIFDESNAGKNSADSSANQRSAQEQADLEKYHQIVRDEAKRIEIIKQSEAIKTESERRIRISEEENNGTTKKQWRIEDFLEAVKSGEEILIGYKEDQRVNWRDAPDEKVGNGLSPNTSMSAARVKAVAPNNEVTREV